MKKTSYILIILVALTFISQIAIGAYLWSHRISYEEYRARHPGLFSDDITESEDYYIVDEDEKVPDTDAEVSEPIVIDAADNGLEVVVISDDYRGVEATTYYTDTLIITSPRKNIRVTSMLR